ncbi:UBC core domain-containing protein [Caenorhabditis elegans]|nr:UBC core domain-containing protein [Caenorhabditis elegans]CCD68334.1 UBC core domain-containing protein [Caenorhabditis elegans]|eukprot:NP_001040756.1 UBiquitin Conjugating enzyme [Caenorhabditis elegans]
MKEAMELRQPTEMYHAQPMEDNLFEWHFTIRGTLGTDFEGGIYHGRIIFPADYPMKPPNLILLTPNGRFELNKKVCLSISGYHPETWLPSWSIRTALLALIGFLPSTPGGALGSLDYPPKERQRLAKLSCEWKCKECGCVMKTALLPITEDGQLKQTEEAKTLAAQLKFQDESVVKKEVEAANNQKNPTETEPSEETSSVPTENVEESEEDADEREEGTTVNVNSSEVPDVAQPAVQPIRDPQPLVFQHHAPRLASTNFDYTLLYKIPVIALCFAIFFTLLARRFLVDNLTSPKDGSEL